MNIYRGCTHGCIYCDVRSKCYGFTHPIEDVEVKENAVQLLDDTLRRKRKKMVIGTGAMGDPYQHCEQQLLLMRRCLEVILRHGFGVSVHTKSNRLLRDIDLLEQIHRRAKCVVQTTLTTTDDALSRIIEPHVCTTRERIDMLHALKARHIPTVVWLCPVLPHITDSSDNVHAIIDHCIEADVKGIVCFNMGMTLREGDREYFYQKLDRHFPGMKERYIAEFGNAYEVLSPHHEHLMREFRRRCGEAGIICTPDEVFARIQEFPERNRSLELPF